MRSIFLSLWLSLAFLSPTQAAEPAAVAIELADGRSVVLSPTLLADLPKQTVSATSHGRTASYAGYDLRLVLAAAGSAPVEGLRGNRLPGYITVTAADGYRVVFSLGELDKTLGDTLVLLADTENGHPLPATDGPWRLVVPGDQRAARSVRQLTSIRITGE